MSFIQRTLNRYQYALILLKELVITDFKLRYQNSILGYVWSLLRPLFTFLILYLVFVRFLKFGSDIPHIANYLLLGIVLWNFFAEVTTNSVSSILSKGDLIRKINFPKYVIVLATSLSALINLFLNFVIIVIFMFIFGADPSWYATLTVPLLVIELYVLALGFGFFLSAANVRFRDIGYIWEVGMQAGFYLTPIIYPITKLPEWAQKASLLNPIAQVVQDSRYFLITDQTVIGAKLFESYFVMLIPFTIVIIVLLLGAFFFRKNSRTFAEEA